ATQPLDRPARQTPRPKRRPGGRRLGQKLRRALTSYSRAFPPSALPASLSRPTRKRPAQVLENERGELVSGSGAPVLSQCAVVSSFGAGIAKLRKWLGIGKTTQPFSRPKRRKMSWPGPAFGPGPKPANHQ